MSRAWSSGRSSKGSPSIGSPVRRADPGRRGGLDGTSSATGAERLADWLGGTYEPFGAHSHYGLIIGEQSFQQVADGVRAFLETHRL